MQKFQEIGSRIEAEWRSEDHNENRFPAIAAEHLRESDLPSQVDVWEILEWSLTQTELPRQKDPNSNFGDPAITLYTSPKFHIDVYFWFEGTTSIHQHGFCGAFQVLHGSSIHSWYDFTPKEKINVFMETGQMSLKVCELLEKGAVQEIRPGRQYIHSLFHLDSPSVTICVRTDKSPLEPPQFNYQKPSLAIDPFFSEETQNKKMQVISALLRANRPDADDQIAAFLAEADFQNTYAILGFLKRAVQGNQIEKMFDVANPQDRFARFLDIAKLRHGEKVGVLTDVFAHTDKVNEIIRRRSFVKDPEHRFFFALLLNVETKEQIFSLIKQRYPDDDPRERVLDWVFDLSQTRIAGAGQHNALGIDPFDDLDLTIFEYLLDSTPVDEIPAVLETAFPTERLAPLKEGLSERIENIRSAVIFGALFS